jgi:GNAT superfamily N-acetyltransferase
MPDGEGRTWVKRADPQDEARAVQLLNEKRSPAAQEKRIRKRRETWQWRYHRNPNNPDDRPFLIVARVGDEIGGMMATVPVMLRTPKGLVRAAWAVDLIVDPEMRGHGLGRRLVAEMIRHFDASMGLGYNPGSMRVLSAVGYHLVTGFATRKIVLSRSPCARSALRAGKYRDLLQIGRMMLTRKGARSDPSGLTASVATELPRHASELWAEVAAAYAFCVERDEAYLHWRYTTHPTHEYHFVTLEAGGRPAALAVARVKDADPPRGIIADLIVPPGRPDLVAALLDETCGFLESRGACAAVVDLPPALASIVTGQDRRTLTQPLGMLVYTADQDLRESGFLDASAWLISRSDSDLDH